MSEYNRYILADISSMFQIGSILVQPDRAKPSELKRAIENGELCQPRTNDVDSDGDVDYLFACYIIVPQDIADHVAVLQQFETWGSIHGCRCHHECSRHCNRQSVFCCTP